MMKLTTPETRADIFFAERRSLMLATAGESGPTASYAPFVWHNGCFYIYVSELSRHTADLALNRDASVLLIEDESVASNIFARKRITYTVKAERVTGVKERATALELFREKFGKVFEVILPLSDFILFRLTPSEAIYVEGFGRAYRMNPLLRNAVHIQGTGPGAKDLPRKTASPRKRKAKRRAKKAGHR